MKVGRCSKVGEICSNYLPIVPKMQNILSVRRALYLYSTCVVEESSTLSLIKGFTFAEGYTKSSWCTYILPKYTRSGLKGGQLCLFHFSGCSMGCSCLSCPFVLCGAVTPVLGSAAASPRWPGWLLHILVCVMGFLGFEQLR